MEACYIWIGRVYSINQCKYVLANVTQDKSNYIIYSFKIMEIILRNLENKFTIRELTMINLVNNFKMMDLINIG